MKKAQLIVSAFVLTIVLSSIWACNKDDNPAQPTTKTLYDSLGGTTMVADPANASTMIEQGRLGIRSVVDSTIFVIAADPELNPYFTVLLSEVGMGDLSGFQALSKNLTDFFCVATGAKNYTYSGKNMVDAHNPATNARMNGKADNGDFDAFVTDLVKGAKQNGLPDNLIARVGAIVETLRSQVVQQ